MTAAAPSPASPTRSKAPAPSPTPARPTANVGRAPGPRDRIGLTGEIDFGMGRHLVHQHFRITSASMFAQKVITGSHADPHEPVFERGVFPIAFEPFPRPDENLLSEILEFVATPGEARRHGEHPVPVSTGQIGESVIVPRHRAFDQVGIVTLRHRFGFTAGMDTWRVIDATSR